MSMLDTIGRQYEYMKLVIHLKCYECHEYVTAVNRNVILM